MAACGCEYHGPGGHIGFAPRLSPENLRCAFTEPEGWGSFTQIRDDKQQTHAIQLAYGSLRLNQLRFTFAGGEQAKALRVMVGSTQVSATFEQNASRVQI